MKIFIDTNILISAALWPGSTPSKALQKASVIPNTGIICLNNIDEVINTFYRKFSDRIPLMESFLFWTTFHLEFVSVPSEPYEAEQLIRDEKDRPILRAAINAGADILLTGDKDFLEAGITNPRIMSASEFLELT